MKMGVFKNLIIDHPYWYDDTKLEKFILRENVDAAIRMYGSNNNPELREFLELVTPTTGPDYFIYVRDSFKVYTNIKYSRAEYIDALCCLSDIDYYTLFYHIASFYDWIENENATATRCLYVDIDDVGINANEGDKDTVIFFLKNELKLNESEFPDFGILSGHGLHACWLIDEITPKDEELREKYLGSLITRMKGDFSGFPISHQFRCPCSYNLKDEKIKGKLFKLTDCSNTDIHRLDWCLKTPEEILEYRSNYYTRVFEKGLATAEKNRQLEKEFLEQLGETTVEEYLSDKNISDENRKIAEKVLKFQTKRKATEKLKECLADKENSSLENLVGKDELELYIYSEKALPYEHLRVYDGYKAKNRTCNLILDLHNFFIRNKGFLVSRNMFFFILANLLKSKDQTERAAIKWCLKYVDDEFKDEMIEIVQNVYNLKKTYRFTNKKIAGLLCFSDSDIAESYCLFSDERRKEAKKIRNQNYYINQLNKTGKLTPAERKAIHLEYLQAHPDIKPKEAMEVLGIGKTTFFSLKKILNTNEDNNPNSSKN